MDIVAKHTEPDSDSVRIAELNKESFRYLLWDHQPLTDFWQSGPGIARPLARLGISTMGECLVYNKNTQNCRGDSPKLQREIPQ